MAENEIATSEFGSADFSTAGGGTALAEAPAAEYTYQVSVEDAGPATKKVSIEIPEDRIKAKLSEQFKELRQQANIPGFRVGHAPAKLIEKRFGSDAREQVRRNLISESYGQAVERNALQVLGEPEFEKIEEIKLPDSGPFKYSFQVEVQPLIVLPPLQGLRIRRPKIDVKDENVDQAMNNLREQQGNLVPVEDRGVEPKDYVIADVHITADGAEVVHQHDVEIVARPARLGGIEIADLEVQLTGLKSGEEKVISAHAPATHGNEQLRDKDVQISIKVKEIKKVELAEITPEFLADLGFDDEKQLREALREQMVERINYDVQQAMREQVNNYLLQTVHIDLPNKLSDKQADRIAARRTIDMLMKGLPQDQATAQLEALRGGEARDEAVRELKLFFILQKIANDLGVDVDEAELNGRVAMLAAQRGKRPEKVKQEMGKDGTLSNLYIQMREQKALDRVLEAAVVEEVDVTAAQAQLEHAGAAAASTPEASQEAPALEGSQGSQG